MSKKDFLKLRVLIPPVTEQQRIVDILGAWDKSINLNEQLVFKKKQTKQWYVKTLLGNGSDSSSVKPSSWIKVNLDEVIEEFIVPMRDKPKEFRGTIPWCRIEDFNGVFLKGSRERRFVDKDIISDMNLKVYPVGTVLCSCSAELGRCAITDVPLVTNQTFIGLVAGKKINNLFLYYLMTYNAKSLQKLSSGTTIAYLSRRQFEKFSVTIPKNIAEQEKFAKFLFSCDSEIALISQRLFLLRQQKKGLMQKLLTGQLRAKV